MAKIDVNQVSIKKEIAIKAVAYFQLAGGCVGLLTTLIIFFSLLHKVFKAGNVSFYDGAMVMFFPLLFAFIFLLMLRAAVLLLRYDGLGFRLSIFLQILQLPVIISKHLSYNFYAAAQVAFGYVKSPTLSGLQFKYQYGSYYWLSFSLPGGVELQGFFINLLALFCLFLLFYSKSASK